MTDPKDTDANQGPADGELLDESLDEVSGGNSGEWHVDDPVERAQMRHHSANP
jgi:hypothetical protein